jgi:hypothetical protein
VRTDVELIGVDPGQLPEVERALADLPGAMATGGFLGLDDEYPSRAWVLRDIDELSTQ